MIRHIITALLAGVLFAAPCFDQVASTKIENADYIGTVITPVSYLNRCRRAASYIYPAFVSAVAAASFTTGALLCKEHRGNPLFTSRIASTCYQIPLGWWCFCSTTYLMTLVKYIVYQPTTSFPFAYYETDVDVYADEHSFYFVENETVEKIPHKDIISRDTSSAPYVSCPCGHKEERTLATIRTRDKTLYYLPSRSCKNKKTEL